MKYLIVGIIVLVIIVLGSTSVYYKMRCATLETAIHAAVEKNDVILSRLSKLEDSLSWHPNYNNNVLSVHPNTGVMPCAN